MTKVKSENNYSYLKLTTITYFMIMCYSRYPEGTGKGVGCNDSGWELVGNWESIAISIQTRINVYLSTNQGSLAGTLVLRAIKK